MDVDKFYLEKVFPDADVVFSYHNKAVDEIKDTCIYVLDTMILLIPYFTSKESVSDFEKIFTKLKKAKRLFIPARVAREFAKNRGQKIAETFSKIVESQNRLNSAQISLEKFPIFESNPDYIQLREIEEQIQTLKNNYREKLSNLSEKLKNWKWDDPVSLMYKTIFTKDTIIEVEQKSEELERNLEFRFKHQIPPGYKKSDQDKIDSGIGDLIIWQTTLEIGKKHKSDVIFVTNEEQNDWFYRQQGTAISTKYELIDEFRRIANGKSINIVNFSDFLVSQNAQQETVDEIKILYADSGYKIIEKDEFLNILAEYEEKVKEKDGFLGAKYFVETVLADKKFDIGSSWELCKSLNGKDIEMYVWNDPQGTHRPLNALRIKINNIEN